MKTLMILVGFWCFSLWSSSPKQVLPLDSSIKVNGAHVEITIKAKADIPELEFLSVRGIDGLKIISSQLPPKLNLKNGETVIVPVEIERPSGRVYLGLNLRSHSRKQTLNFALGNVSAKQRTKKTSAIQTANGKKRHVLRVEQKK